MRPSVVRAILAAALSATLPSTSPAVRPDADRVEASGPVPPGSDAASVQYPGDDRGATPLPDREDAGTHDSVSVTSPVGCPAGFRRFLDRQGCSGAFRRYWGLAGLGLLAVATGGRLLASRSHRPYELDFEGREEGPFLVFPARADPAGAPLDAMPPEAGVPPTRAGSWHGLAASVGRPCAAEDGDRRTPLTVHTDHVGVSAAANGDSVVVPREDAPPSDRVELLPGRLEVVFGPEPGLEFRFTRSPGARVQEVTIGRGPGPPGRHVRLAVATVSRSHARMRFEKQQWYIENLSTTNPVQVNDREVPMGEGPRVLMDGDRIRLGEVVLRYRQTSP